MAEAQTTPGDNMVICAVCLEDMASRNPRALSCLHTFCEICMEKLAAENANIICPTCRKVTTLPEGRVLGLPINFMINAFAETSVCTSKICCQLCETASRQPPSYRCSDCCVYTCSSCMKAHLGAKVTADHRILVCDDYDESCKYHNLPSKFWCSTCEMEVCAKCLSSKKHLTHNLSRPSGTPSREKLENTRALILDLAKTKLSLTHDMELATVAMKQKNIQSSEVLKQKLLQSENELLTQVACFSQSSKTSVEIYNAICEELKDETFAQTSDVTATEILSKSKLRVSDEIITVLPNFCVNAMDMEVGMFSGKMMKQSNENAGSN